MSTLSFSVAAYDSLSSAAHAGDADAVAAFIARGADVNARADSAASAPVVAATQSGHLRVALQLVDAGADLGEGRGAMLLESAVEADRIDVVDELLRRRRGDVIGALPLHQDVSLAMVRRLLAAGFDPRAINEQAESPVLVAGHSHRFDACDVIAALLEAGADPNAGRPLDRAVAIGDARMAQILLAHGAALELGHLDDASTLWLAVVAGRDELVDELLGKGVAPHRSALTAAATCGNASMVLKLLARGAPNRAVAVQAAAAAGTMS